MIFMVPSKASHCIILWFCVILLLKRWMSVWSVQGTVQTHMGHRNHSSVWLLLSVCFNTKEIFEYKKPVAKMKEEWLMRLYWNLLEWLTNLRNRTAYGCRFQQRKQRYPHGKREDVWENALENGEIVTSHKVFEWSRMENNSTLEKCVVYGGKIPGKSWISGKDSIEDERYHPHFNLFYLPLHCSDKASTGGSLTGRRVWP